MSLITKINHSDKCCPWSYEPLPEVALWVVPATLFLEVILSSMWLWSSSGKYCLIRCVFLEISCALAERKRADECCRKGNLSFYGGNLKLVFTMDPLLAMYTSCSYTLLRGKIPGIWLSRLPLSLQTIAPLPLSSHRKAHYTLHHGPQWLFQLRVPKTWQLVQTIKVIWSSLFQQHPILSISVCSCESIIY